MQPNSANEQTRFHIDLRYLVDYNADTMNENHSHSHDPNPTPPGDDASIELLLPNQPPRSLTVAQLRALPYTQVQNCYIVSTGHGTSGPFVFGGVRLRDLCEWLAIGNEWRYIDVDSGDSFGARITSEELLTESSERPILLAWQVDDLPLTRTRGLVRLIVPSEVGEALRQVKWVARIKIF